MNWWNKIEEVVYKRMRKQHAPLREYLLNFIDEKNVISILEVGCGLISQFKNTAPVYQAIDINVQTDAIHEDFTKLSDSVVLGFKDKFDLLLANSVIEHCEFGYRDFIYTAAEINAKYTIIGFFNGLNRKDDYFFYKTSHGGEYPWNKYSQKKMEKFLKEIGIADRSEFIRLGRHDTILIIKGI